MALRCIHGCLFCLSVCLFVYKFFLNSFVLCCYYCFITVEASLTTLNMITSSRDIRKLYHSINNFKDKHSQIIYQVKVNGIPGVKLIGCWFAGIS